LLYHLGKNMSQLESRGLSVPELAEQIGLSREETEGWCGRLAGTIRAC